MKRRDFLKGAAAGAAAGLMAPTALFGANQPDIVVAEGGPEAAVRAAVKALGGMSRFVKPGQSVTIKPNMSFATGPERASNTHPLVVSTLAALCKEADAGRVRVLDNPLSRAERCLENSGIQSACEPIDKDMVQMVVNPSLFKEVDIAGGSALKETDIMKAVLASDVLIAAPVAKSHSGAGVSLSMKGMMGLVQNRWVFHRRDLQTSIVDLASVLKPDLVVIDATRVLSSGGPGGPGKVLRPNKVIASTDMVAADAYTVASFEWYGRQYKPRQVRHILEAHQRGLGRMDIDNLTVKSISA